MRHVKRILLISFTAVMLLMISSFTVYAGPEDFDALPAVYVASEARGNGSGSSPENALGNKSGYDAKVASKDASAWKDNALFLGFQKIASTGGTVVVCGPLTLDSADAFRDTPAEFHVPLSKTDKKFRLTSLCGENDFRSGAYLALDQTVCQSLNLSFNAPVEIDNIEIRYVYDDGTRWYPGPNATVFIEFGGYSSVVGDGVSVVSLPKEGATKNRYPTLIAGRRYISVDSTDLTVCSGKWETVIAGSHGMSTKYPATVNGDARLHIKGGEITLVSGAGGTDDHSIYTDINGSLEIVIEKGATVRFANGNPSGTSSKNKKITYDVTSLNEKAVANFETATKTGEGDVPPYVEFLYDHYIKDGYAVLTSVKNYSGAKTLVIPDSVDGYSVKELADSFSYSGARITDLIFPDTLERIGSGAFAGFERVYSIDFPDTLEEIGENSFTKCWELAVINIPAGTEIGENTFSSCPELKIRSSGEGKAEKYAHTNGIPFYIASGYGDANYDGKISSSDVVRLKKYFAEYDPDAGVSSVTVGDGADANGDRKTSSSDIVRLKKYFAEFDPDTGSSNVRLGPEPKAQKEPFTFYPEDYTLVKEFPAPEGDRREIVLGYMLAMANYEWTPAEDFTIGWRDSARFSVNLKFYAGKVYLGLPYSETTSSLDMFDQFVYNGTFKENTYFYEEITGNNCSQSMMLCYQQLVNIPVVPKPTMTKEDRDGLLELPVDRGGNAILEHPRDHGYDGLFYTDAVFAVNTKQQIFKGFAALGKGDILYKSVSTGGHTRMVSRVEYVYDENGNIDGDKSFVYAVEQTNAWDKERTDVNSTWWINHRYSFNTLYNTNFYPETVNAFHEDTPLETAYILYNGNNSPENAMTCLNGTVSSNFPLTYLLLTLRDGDGKIVSYAKAYRSDFTQFYSCELEDYREELFNGVAPGTYTFTARAGIARGGVDLESFEVTIP